MLDLEHVILGSEVSEFLCLHMPMLMKIDLFVCRVIIHGVDIIPCALIITFLYCNSLSICGLCPIFMYSFRHSYIDLGEGIRSI